MWDDHFQAFLAGFGTGVWRPAGLFWLPVHAG